MKHIFYSLLFVPIICFAFISLFNKNIRLVELTCIYNYRIVCFYNGNTNKQTYLGIFPIFPKLQFPFAQLAIISLIGTVSTILIFDLIEKSKPYKIISYLALSIFSLIVVFNISQNIMYSTPINRDDFQILTKELENKESYECWWSIWAKSGAFNNKEKIFASNRQTTIISWKPEIVAKVNEGLETKVRISTFYYPHWKATVNEIPVTVEKDENGVILIPVPAEESNVKLYFEEPLIVKIACFLSILGWIFLSASLSYCKIKPRLIK